MDEFALVPMKDLASTHRSSPRARKTTLSVVVSYYVITRIHPLSRAPSVSPSHGERTWRTLFVGLLAEV